MKKIVTVDGEALTVDGEAVETDDEETMSEYNIGAGLRLDAGTNTLSVNAASTVEEGNTNPVMSTAVWELIGNLSDLTTTAKNNLVAAINEAAKTGSGGAGSIDLRTADGYIQYSTDNGETWENLIALADLKGEDGAPGMPGTDGKDGAPGQDGFSPSASVAETATGATITITDKTGTTTAEIKNGKDGAPGKAGTNGKDGADGADGTTFTPSVSAAGDLSWTNDGGKANPAPVNIKGPQGAPGKDYTLTDADKTEIAVKAAAAIAGTSVPAPASAAVGQIVKVKAVDAAGKITQTEAVDMPTGGGNIDLGLTGAAVGDIIKVKSVDTAGKPTAWENVAPPLGTLKTRYDTIVDYTFNGTSTLSTAEGLSDYVLWNGCKAVWNKDAQGNPLKAVRMWGYIECTKAVTQEAGLPALKLSAACRGSYFYQDTPSSWYYGDDIGNGVGTYELNDESILNSKSISINRTTYGWCDHIARCGAIQIPANNPKWVENLRRSFTAASVLNLPQANYYKDYIYAAMLMVGGARSDYIIPDGVRIVVVAEVIDE